MSIFHIKCECGNKISKFGWRLEKRKDGKLEYTNICKKCGNKYIKSNNIFLKWFGEGILSFNLAVVVTFFINIIIEIKGNNMRKMSITKSNKAAKSSFKLTPIFSKIYIYWFS